MLTDTKRANLPIQGRHALFAMDVEYQSIISKDILVMICRVVMHDNLVALLEPIALPLDVLSHRSAHRDKCRVVAEHLFDSVGDVLGMID